MKTLSENLYSNSEILTVLSIGDDSIVSTHFLCGPPFSQTALSKVKKDLQKINSNSHYSIFLNISSLVETDHSFLYPLSPLGFWVISLSGFSLTSLSDPYLHFWLNIYPLLNFQILE
jgi:hypothetical protein